MEESIKYQRAIELGATDAYLIFNGSSCQVSRFPHM